MIGVEEIKTLATEWGVAESIVEKNYVIGWLLWGISQDPDLNHKWVFKGGTCIKKCYLETYRFSEDLDFTVLPAGPSRPDELGPILNRIMEHVHAEAGINFSSRPIYLKQGKYPFYTEGRIYYQGPRNTRNPESVVFDILSSEKLIKPPVRRSIGHSFSDDRPKQAKVLSYSLEEIFAEKIRAIGERCLSRDLYDIVFLFRENYFNQQSKLIKSILIEKCKTKGVPVPTFESIQKSPRFEELKGEWTNMLAHQLPSLPPFESFWNDLPKLFEWLEGKYLPEELASAPLEKGEKIIWRPTPELWESGRGTPIESIRFAAINYLQIELGYNGTKRLIEPYSLRQNQEGDLLLSAIRVVDRQSRSYRIDRIESVSITKKPFVPVYKIEFPELGTIYAPQISRSSSSFFSTISRRKSKGSPGIKYIFRCSVCGKKFTRSKNDSRLKKHKNRSGGDCYGTYGIYEGTKYA
jgi:predicted nucleotidyltransferase component of viral defense system